MATRDEVGQAIRELKTSTGWTWGQVAHQLGTTPEYARKLARGQGSSGAGAALRANIEREARTGRPQAPVQRRTKSGGTQRVRQRGGRPSERAAPRTAPPRRAFNVERSRFAGPAGGRDGWQERVTLPKRNPGRESGRQAIMDAMRRAAQGRRRVAFRVEHHAQRPGQHQVLGGNSGYNASAALDGARAEGRDPLEWLATQAPTNGETGSDGEFEAGDIEAVTVVALP